MHVCISIVEAAQAARENVREAMRTILNRVGYESLYALEDDFVKRTWPDVLKQSGEFDAFRTILSLWAQHTNKPVVLFIDEVDTLIGDPLISLLRQLRSGYADRPARFPQSIILCGVRDVRDYRIHSSREKAIITGGSAFNIKAASLRLGDFSREETEQLYQSHTGETGQTFTVEAIDLPWEQSQGQPWLVNALGYEVCFTMKAGKDRSHAITKEMVEQAKEAIILRRETHIDQLIDKLQEERVQRVIGPMLQGEEFEQQVSQDDIQYVLDLGLITRRRPQGMQISNPIYREVIPRELGFITQLNLESLIQPAWYITDDGSLDMDKLLTAFQDFFRKHSEHWVERFQYKEAGPQLLIQAYLQRIVNGGGRIEREYGLGRKRTDILVVWPYENTVQEVAIELKIRCGDLEKTIRDALKQTWDYMDRCGTSEGHLLIFDQNTTSPWEDKIFHREEAYKGHPITVRGM